MAENDISISEMTNGTFTSGALFPAISPNQGGTGYYNVKMSGADIGDGIGQLQFPLRLETENKSIFGAINEAANKIIDFLPIDTASGALASFPDGANGIPLQAIALNVTPAQSGSGDPSPSNVRPITGHDTAVITRTGVNLWDEEWEVGAYNNDGEKIVNASTIRNKNKIVASGSCYFEFSGFSPVRTIRLVQYDKNLNCISSVGALEINKVITLDSNCRYIAFNCAPSYGTTYNHDISINYPSTDTSYHAYTATTRTVSFGQTIYGATIDPLTGEGTITHGFIESYNGETIGTPWKCDRAVYSSGTTPPTGSQVYYPLATPVPITFEPIENINTLYGANNIFQDAGDISVTYKADIGLYIAKKTA